jgi:DnaJ-class molecular chaperone
MLQHPAADAKSIKTAYYSMMRLYHPDQQGGTSSGSSTDADDSIDINEFCALLNEIYTVSVCFDSPHHRGG